MATYRYSQWDGSQDRFDMNADELMDELGRSLMSYGDLAYALRQLQRGGLKDSQGRNLPSIQELLQRLRQNKQKQLEKYDLSSVIDDIRKKLDNIIDSEQRGIKKRLDDARQKAAGGKGEISPELEKKLLKNIEKMAARNQQKLKELPPDVGGQIQELSKYDFMDEGARNKYSELMNMLKHHSV